MLPGAVNPGPCSVATGYYCDNPFIVSGLVVTKAWNEKRLGRLLVIMQRSKVRCRGLAVYMYMYM